MNNITTKIFDLPNIGDSRANFYGKAQQIEYNDGTKELKSYDTIVCRITNENKVIRLWSGYSLTTMRHINSFLLFNNISGNGKAFWDSLPITQNI